MPEKKGESKFMAMLERKGIIQKSDSREKAAKASPAAPQKRSDSDAELKKMLDASDKRAQNVTPAARQPVPGMINPIIPQAEKKAADERTAPRSSEVIIETQRSAESTASRPSEIVVPPQKPIEPAPAATVASSPKPVAPVAPRPAAAVTPSPKPAEVVVPLQKPASPVTAPRPVEIIVGPQVSDKPAAPAAPPPKPAAPVTPPPAAAVSPPPKPAAPVTPPPAAVVSPPQKPAAPVTPPPAAAVTPPPKPAAPAAPRPAVIVPPPQTPVLAQKEEKKPKTTDPVHPEREAMPVETMEYEFNRPAPEGPANTTSHFVPVDPFKEESGEVIHTAMPETISSDMQVQYEAEPPANENYTDRYLDVDELYEALSMSKKRTDTIYLVEEYFKTLPDSLPEESRRDIVGKIVAASGFDYDLLMGDGVLRVRMLKEYAEHFAKYTEDYVSSCQAELDELDRQVARIRNLVEERRELHKKQFFTIEKEAQRLKEILTFIAG